MDTDIFNSNQKQETHSEDIKNFYENSHVIVIGINNYKEESPLTNAGNDARAIKNVLEKNTAST